MKILTVTCIFLELVIVLVPSLIDGQTEPVPWWKNNNATARPWLRICDQSRTNTFLLDGAECAGGFMFTQPFIGGRGLCVCGNGIWVLKDGYCDSTAKAYVLFAKVNSCFNIKTDIRWIRYIGHPERTELDSHYVISGDWDYLEQLAGSGPSSLIVSKTVWTMATGDSPENIYLPAERICFRSDWRPLGSNPVVDGNAFVRIGRTEYASNSTSADPHQAQRLSYCPYFAKEETTNWLFGGGMLEVSRSSVTVHPEPTETVHDSCHNRCSNSPAFQVDDTATTKKPDIEPKLDPEGMAVYPYSGEESIAKQLEDLMPLNETKTEKSQCEPDPDRSRDMDFQTMRMIRAQAGFALKQIKAPAVKLKEFQYLRKSRQILAQKCPELPETLIKSFIRMFRVALVESLENHPYREAGVNESHGRILEGLDSCLNATGGPERNMTFMYEPESCPPLLTGLQFTPDGESTRNCSARVPKHLQFKSCDLDVVLEVTWKTILFSHYFCARHLVNVTLDVSEFYVTMERLFNPDLLMRYYSPGNSYKGMQYVFQMYDLEKFMSDLDKCVACARDLSQYRAWLKRPKNLRMCPMTGKPTNPDEYNFDIGGYRGIKRSPKYLPYKKIKTREYQCYSSWYDGLYTRPRMVVKPSCGLGLHVIGQTATFE